MANGQIVVAVLIESSVHVHRVKSVNEAKDILATAKPDIVGMDISSAEICDEIGYSFNTIKVERTQEAKTKELLSKLTLLNIMKEGDKPAIIAAYNARENSKD